MELVQLLEDVMDELNDLEGATTDRVWFEMEYRKVCGCVRVCTGTCAGVGVSRSHSIFPVRLSCCAHASR